MGQMLVFCVKWVTAYKVFLAKQHGFAEILGRHKSH